METSRYTGKPDWIGHVMLNQKTISEWSIVNGSFFNSITSQANFTVFQITFQVIKIKKARFQLKTFLERSKLQFTFFSRFKVYFNHDW